MVKFLCNKLGRDKGIQSFKDEGIIPHYKILSGQELCDALKIKLVEEVYEVSRANNVQEVTSEIADVLEVVDGLIKAYGISLQELMRVKEDKYRSRGGFETGLYIETIEMEDNNPKVAHFASSAG